MSLDADGHAKELLISKSKEKNKRHDNGHSFVL